MKTKKVRITITLDPSAESLVGDMANLFNTTVSGFVESNILQWKPFYEILIERAKGNRAEAEAIRDKVLVDALESLK